MATEQSLGSGSEPAPSGSANFAERLLQQHVPVNGHEPMVEDVVDEEDILHPPPSSIVPASQPQSEKALGKQRVEEPRAANNVSIPDTKSEELFPALGGGSRSRPQGPVSTAWGTKKPTSVASSTPNGVNGHSHISSATSSRPSTPAFGNLTPAPTNTGGPSRGTAPQSMSMPGRHSESVQFAPSQLLHRTQLKKPLDVIIRDINKRSKAKVEWRHGPGGVLCFEGKGPVDAVRQALKDVAKEVGNKQAIKVPIPASVRPFIIGKQGATIQSIAQRTGAKIQVPKTEDSAPLTSDDDDVTVDVSIEGDAVAAEMARQEIERIVGERTSSVNLRMRDIPAEYYPFLAGPHGAGVSSLENGRNVKVKIPHYYSWSQQPPPQPSSSNSPPEFAAHPTAHIHLSGDRRAAQEVRAEIERRVAILRQQITLAQVPGITRGQHQFIVGENGVLLHDLLRETGCAVILPPESDESEVLSITGPPHRIESGIDKVMDLAASMQMSSVDIGRLHGNAHAHARALTRYLQQREAIAMLEKMHNSHIVLPAAEDGPVTWEVYSRDGKNNIRAKSDITNVINAHPPSRLRHIDMDPFYHDHLREAQIQHLRDEFGVHVLLPPQAEEDSQVVLVYEGPAGSEPQYELPRQRPSQADNVEFEKALRQAHQHLIDIVAEQGSIGTRTVETPSKFYDKIRNFVSREQQELPPGKLPIQVIVGKNDVVLRGPEDRLDDLAEKLRAFVESEKQDELERRFTMSFEFPQKHANYLIGRRGDNINKLREEFDVDIQLKDGQVELKGPKAKAQAAKSRILAMSKKLDEEATHVLKIKPQYHREMIGAKGSQVNRLQERYNVRVQFPRTQQARDDESVGDAASEAGGARHNRPNQAPDEVIIRGPKKGADEAREELLSLLQWTIDNSHTTSVSVAQNQLPSLIGQGGKEMESIRESTGARIDIPSNRDAADPSGRVELTLRGTKKQVEDAKKLIEQKAKVFDATITKSIDVEKKYHSALIGAGGANIRGIVLQAGGSDDRRDLAKTVRFPRAESDESTIRVEGHKAVVEKIIESIESFVKQKENQVTEVIEVAPEKHRILIGHAGETRKALESQFSVSIDIPRQTVQGAARSQIKVAGTPENVEKAKLHILEMVKEQEGETIQVPRGLHHVVSDNGQLFRRLRQDHKVTVDHNDHKPPPKPSSTPRTRQNGGAMPLITDEQDVIDAHSWEVINHSSYDSETESIPWTLRGNPENVAKARVIVQKALEQAQKHSCTGYLFLPDPKAYRFVIGPGGSQISSIRKQTGCRIDVPRDQAAEAAIEIVGSAEGVNQAKDIILEVVRNGVAGSTGGRRRE